MDVDYLLKRVGLKPSTRDELEDQASYGLFSSNKNVPLTGEELRIAVERYRIFQEERKILELEYKKKFPNKSYPGFVYAMNELGLRDMIFPIDELNKRYIFLQEIEYNVFLVRRKHDNNILTIKFIHKSIHSRESEMFKLLSEPCYPFIVCFYGEFYDEYSGIQVIEMEYIKGSNILGFFNKLREQTNPEKFYVYVLSALKDLRKALDYIHSKGITHGDLTVANIMVNDKNIPKIIDFGIACFIGENCPWTISSDLLLLGKVFYEIVTQKYHVNGKYLNTANNELNGIVNKLLKQETSLFHKGIRPAISTELSVSRVSSASQNKVSFKN